ncbi:hypothetical protein SK38_04546 [Citrobacter sp. MGH110]|nr:hypothetical protein SK38_04546 [Citrobacter sp. MGH110]
MKMGKMGVVMILESGSQIKYRHWFLLFEFCIVRKMYYTPLTYS